MFHLVLQVMEILECHLRIGKTVQENDK